MFFIIRFLIVWTIWLIFADKKRWRELFPVGIFAGYLGLITDVLSTHYTLWEYQGGHFFLRTLLDDMEIYIVVPYLFIQWLPQRRTWGKMFRYWMIWTGVCIGIEWIHFITNHIEYHKWWNIGYSYMADWFLFWLIYKFHQVFKLDKLSVDNS